MAASIPAPGALFLALSTLSLMSACRSAPATPAPDVSADTWAVVDGRTFMRDDVEKAFRRTTDAQGLLDDEVMTAKLNLLNELIIQDILVAKAGQLKLEVTAAELDAAYADARKNISDE